MENIKNRLFGKDRRCFMVAEISANHGQDLNRAVVMIKKAKECGADAVKFQAYTADTMTIMSKNKYFMIKHPKWGGQTLYELYQKAYTPWDWFSKLKKVADDSRILFFSSAFDKTSVDFLEKIGVPFHKIASFELIDIPLIEYTAGTKKPIILSTGMATRTEIGDALKAARRAGAKDTLLLKCVSSYPAKADEMNLCTIPHMRKLFGCPVGLSDHTMGIEVAIGAVCLGAVMIEKHFTLSRKIKTPDNFFSLEPKELRALVTSIRTLEKALGAVRYGATDEEKKNRIFRRSLFAVRDIKAGEEFTEENIRSIRPGYGLAPKFFKEIIGRKSKKDIKRGTPLNWNIIDY